MEEIERLVIFLIFSVPNDDFATIRHGKEERTFGHIQHGERSMSEIFRKMERNGPGRIRGESAGQNVPLPARPHQLLP